MERLRILDDRNKRIRHLVKKSDLFCEQELHNNFQEDDSLLAL